VSGKTAIIVDDLISTGTTIARTVKACTTLGASRVYAVASHGLFVGDAAQVLADDALARIVITDTVPPFRLPDGKVKSKLTILDSAPLFAEAIARIHTGGSISELLED